MGDHTHLGSLIFSRTNISSIVIIYLVDRRAAWESIKNHYNKHKYKPNTTI